MNTHISGETYLWPAEWPSPAMQTPAKGQGVAYCPQPGASALIVKARKMAQKKKPAGSAVGHLEPVHHQSKAGAGVAISTTRGP